jgi:hypothetical protein
MKTLVLSTNYQGQQLSCYWDSFTKRVEFHAANKSLTFHTGFGYMNRLKKTKLSESVAIEVHFRKLAKEKIAIIMLKIKGVILKAQAIEISSGLTLSMSSLTYQQLKH